MACLPPAYSPLTGAALLRGAAAALGGGRGPSAALRRITEAFDPAGARLTDSGTSALRLALEAAGRAGCVPVAVPAYGCYDLVSATRGAAVSVVYYDLDPSTLGPDPRSLARAIESGARSVLLACLFGIPIDVDALKGSLDADTLVIEDAAQGVGGAFAGRPIGALGDLSVLSFARGKGRTGGGGGALLAFGDRGAELLSGVAEPTRPRGDAAVVARAVAQWAFTRPSLYGLPRRLPFLRLGETLYREPRPVAGMSRAVAAILEATWEAAEREGEVRRQRGRDYASALGGVAGVALVRTPPGSTAGYLRFPILIESALDAGTAQRAARVGMAAGYPRVLPSVRPGDRDRVVDEAPGAHLLARRLWTLPTHRWVRDRDVDRIVRLLSEVE